MRKTPGKDISVGGISIDQLCAQQIGQLRRCRRLELGIDPVVSGIDSVVGYTRLYGCYISWRSPTMPVAKEINPRLAYERLFGVMRAPAVSQADKQANRDDEALLDLVLDDAQRSARQASDAMINSSSTSISTPSAMSNGDSNFSPSPTRAIGIPSHRAVRRYRRSQGRAGRSPGTCAPDARSDRARILDGLDAHQHVHVRQRCFRRKISRTRSWSDGRPSRIQPSPEQGGKIRAVFENQSLARRATRLLSGQAQIDQGRRRHACWTIR